MLVALSSCQRAKPTPSAAPSASGAHAAALAASATAYAAGRRAQHFDRELQRAEQIWLAKPNLSECRTTLREKSDLELCDEATRALSALPAERAVPVDRVLATLADAALSLARLSKRLRFLSLSELTQRRLPALATSAAVPGKSSAPARPELSAHPEGIEQSDGPISRLMNRAVRLERDVLRQLGAYLEYAPELETRRAGYRTVKKLRDQHPEWPGLDRLLREAALLESDAELKRELRELAARGLPRGPRPDQSAGSR